MGLDMLTQNMRDIGNPERLIGRQCCWFREGMSGTHRCRRAFGKQLVQRLHKGLRFTSEMQISGGQRLMVHAPAIVELVVHRDLNDSRRDGLVPPHLFECAAQVQPVE